MGRDNGFLRTFVAMRICLFWCFLATAACGFAQGDSLLLDLPALEAELLEDYLQNSEQDGDFDFNTLFEELTYYQRRPLDLNRADEQELRSLRLLSDVQIAQLISYREQHGKLIALQELQAIASFDLASIKRVLPFVRVTGGIDDYQVGLGKMLAQGRNELYLRWGRILEEQRGFQPDADGNPRFLGDPNRYYVRFKHRYERKLSYGFTAEKDAGEEFFTGSNKQGFDFYSAHLFLKDYNRRLKAVALGDYAISMGQGLVLFSGFGTGKSSATLSLKRDGRTLRPYTSVAENRFFRGAAATIGLSDRLELTTFVSYRRQDGNVVAPDTTLLGGFNDNQLATISSFINSGLHRTANEIADEGAVGQFSTGASLQYKAPRLGIGANLLYDRFSQPLRRNSRPYSSFYFDGDRLLNASVDYSLLRSNFNFFGETAISQNGAVATLNAVQVTVDRRMDLALLFRHYPRNYQALNANPFAESSGGRNETGLYFGLIFRPMRYIEVRAYYDFWQHPWLRFNADAPSRGSEWLARITYKRRRQLEVYLEARNEVKELNATGNFTAFDFLAENRLTQARVQLTQTVSKALKLRGRFNVANAGLSGREEAITGYLTYFDVLYKPVGSSISFTGRYALFDTPAYALRFYAFENDLLYTFSIPAYFGRGNRYYLNVRWRANRALTLEARYAQTTFTDRDVISSGNNRIDGNIRREVRAQVRYTF